MRFDEIKPIDQMEVLGEGHIGVCYDIGNGNVLKLFGDIQELSEIDKFKYFFKYINESFLFPFEFVTDDEYFLGYITKKSLGKTLEKTFKSLDLEKLSIHSIPLEHNIKQLSKGKILLDDFHSGNIMYDNEKIEVVDSDFYKIDVSLPEDVIRERNLDYYKLVIAELLKTSIMCMPETKYIIQKIMRYEYLSLSGSELLIKIKEEMEKYYKEKINTIDDLHEVLRR